MTLPYTGEKTVNMLGTQTERNDLLFFEIVNLCLYGLYFVSLCVFGAVIFSVLGVG